MTDLLNVEPRSDIHQDHICRCQFSRHVERGCQRDEDGCACGGTSSSVFVSLIPLYSFLSLFPNYSYIGLPPSFLFLNQSASTSHKNPPLSQQSIIPLFRPSQTESIEIQHTLSPPQPIPHTSAAIPEFRLRGLELAEGCGQVLQFLRELVLDVVELGGGEGGEVDYGKAGGVC